MEALSLSPAEPVKFLRHRNSSPTTPRQQRLTAWGIQVRGFGQPLTPGPGRSEYRIIWNVLRSAVYCLLENGRLRSDKAKVRHFMEKYWLYHDEVNGFSVLTDEDVAQLTLGECEEDEGRLWTVETEPPQP